MSAGLLVWTGPIWPICSPTDRLNAFSSVLGPSQDPQGSQPRNFTTVRYQKFIIQTGYFSPYPISAAEDPALAASLFADMKLLTGDPSSSARPSTPLGTEPDASAGAKGSTNKAGGVPRATLRAHGRTSDLFAGGLGTGEAGARGELFVCEVRPPNSILPP